MKDDRDMIGIVERRRAAIEREGTPAVGGSGDPRCSLIPPSRIFGIV
jgi:hypothetical protein